MTHLDGGEHEPKGHYELDKGGSQRRRTHGNEDPENHIQVIEPCRPAEESIHLVQKIRGCRQCRVLLLLHGSVEDPTTRRQRSDS